MLQSWWQILFLIAIGFSLSRIYLLNEIFDAFVQLPFMSNKVFTFYLKEKNIYKQYNKKDDSDCGPHHNCIYLLFRYLHATETGSRPGKSVCATPIADQ